MPSTLLHPDKALGLVLESAPAPRLERCLLASALGRALPRSLPCLVDQPPFDKSSMDGFAYSPLAAGMGESYRVLGSSGAAGQAALPALKPGECCRVMTGAPLPEGAEAVQRVEFCALSPDGASLRFTAAEKGSNIVRRGSNERAGDTLLSPRLLSPQDIGILASSGYAEVEVARRPVVGVLSTGDEIVAPGSALGPASIYDSNGPALCAQATAAGAEARSYGIAQDEREALGSRLALGLGECDILLVSGGVSMGNFDYVPAALEALGVEEVFHRLAIRPGKPCFFGKKGEKLVFGLPGNPMATFVVFELLVRPLIARLLGLDYAPRKLRGRLTGALTQAEAERVDILPVRVLPGDGEGPLLEPLVYHGSSMLSVLAAADALVRLEIGTGTIPKGGWVDARLVRP